MRPDRRTRPHGHDVSTDLLAGAAAGLLAGLAASWVMEMFQARVPAPDTGDDEPATVTAARRLWRVATGEELTDKGAKLGGAVAHYALGMGLGLAYGVTVEVAPAVSFGGGLPFGVAAALALDDTLVPAAGLSRPAADYPLPVHAYSLASHLVFGGALEAVRRGLRGGRGSG